MLSSTPSRRACWAAVVWTAPSTVPPIRSCWLSAAPWAVAKRGQAVRVAVDTIGNFLLSHDMTVYLTIFDRVAHTIGGKLFSDIAAYIDDCYVDAHTHSREIQHHQVALSSVPMGKRSGILPMRCGLLQSGRGFRQTDTVSTHQERRGL